MVGDTGLCGGLRYLRHCGAGIASGTPGWFSLQGAWPLSLPVRLTLSLFVLCPLAPHIPFLFQAVASAAQASLLRQQEELDRKAAELERKERELQNTVANLHGTEGCAGPGAPGVCRRVLLACMFLG